MCSCGYAAPDNFGICIVGARFCHGSECIPKHNVRNESALNEVQQYTWEISGSFGSMRIVGNTGS